jgi:hypothetical protein
MSVTSGASSVSVSLNGRERELQKHLNLVQMELRTIGMASERDDDYEDMIKEADKMQDNILQMSWLFEDLYSMAYEIVGDPETPEEKAFLKQHKIERKLHIKKMNDEHKEKKRLEKEQVKEAKAAKALESKMEM